MSQIFFLEVARTHLAIQSTCRESCYLLFGLLKFFNVLHSWIKSILSIVLKRLSCCYALCILAWWLYCLFTDLFWGEVFCYIYFILQSVRFSFFPLEVQQSGLMELIPFLCLHELWHYNPTGCRAFPGERLNSAMVPVKWQQQQWRQSTQKYSLCWSICPLYFCSNLWMKRSVRMPLITNANIFYPLPLSNQFSIHKAESMKLVPEGTGWYCCQVTLHHFVKDMVIFKRGRKENPGNHRPVSPTTVPGNIMEQMMALLRVNCTWPTWWLTVMEQWQWLTKEDWLIQCS